VETVLFVGLGVLAALALLAAGAWLLWRRATDAQRRLIKRIARLRFGSKLRLAGRLAADPRIPLAMRALPPLLVLYLAMPLDLIPDFIPLLGQLDDVIIVLVGVTLLLRFAPRAVIEQQVAALELANEDARASRTVRGADGS
jgi:uncharacterized membrane protein YkvA (DUF1232 family)